MVNIQEPKISEAKMGIRNILTISTTYHWQQNSEHESAGPGCKTITSQISQKVGLYPTHFTEHPILDSGAIFIYFYMKMIMTKRQLGRAPIYTNGDTKKQDKYKNYTIS